MNFKLGNNSNGLLLLLTAIMFMGISFGAVYFIYDASQSKANLMQTGLVDIEFTEGEAIALTSLVPMIDEMGLENDPYEFTVKNISDIPVNMNIQFINDASSTLPVEAVRYGFYVDDELVGKGSLANLDTNGNFFTYENFQAGDTIDCKLVFWVDYYYTSSRETFGGKIKITAEGFDSIPEK